jgi:hypothetical protein
MKKLPPHSVAGYGRAIEASSENQQNVGLGFSTGRSISLLPVMASVAKARLIFMTFRELRLTRRLNWRNAFSYRRVRDAILASLGKRQSFVYQGLLSL